MLTSCKLLFSSASSKHDLGRLPAHIKDRLSPVHVGARLHVCLPAPLRETFILSTCGNPLPQRRERAHSPRLIASACIRRPSRSMACFLPANEWPTSIRAHDHIHNRPSSHFIFLHPNDAAILHYSSTCIIAFHSSSQPATISTLPSRPTPFYALLAPSRYNSTHSIHFGQAIHPPSAHYYPIAPSL